MYKAKTINSISIIVLKKLWIKLFKKIKVKKRLHLNLTDFRKSFKKIFSL